MRAVVLLTHNRKGLNMPRKGQLTKGKWFKCLQCNSKFWRVNSWIKKWTPKLCSSECRNNYMNKNAYSYKDQISNLYVNKEFSICKIAKKLSLGRGPVLNVLKRLEISIRPMKFYSHHIRNPNFKGGWVTKEGYKRVFNKMEHRTVMESYMGRKLTKHEHVHHLNGNKLDNRIENLSILSPSPHGEYHAKQFNDWKKMYQARISDLESIINKLQCPSRRDYK